MKFIDACSMPSMLESLLASVLVERSPLLVFCPCPFIVSSLLGKYFATAWTVRPGHDAYCLFFISLIHDGLVGKPAHA